MDMPFRPAAVPADMPADMSQLYPRGTVNFVNFAPGRRA